VSVEERRPALGYGEEDDFEYWRRLAGDKRARATVREVESRVEEFAHGLEEIGFGHTSAHIFPFEKRTIGVVFGGHPSSQYSFTISLEGIGIDPKKGTIYVPVARVYRWVGNPEDPERHDFREVLRKGLGVEVEPAKIPELLKGIYNEVAQAHGLPLLR